MQPDNSPESRLELQHLSKTGECRFDLMMKGARLCSVAFGFRSNKTLEEYHHSFVGEIACGRWRIAQNKRYLWGTYFYWICDCNSMKEILEYTGIIHQLRRWSQEIFAYDFSIVHRPAKMMKNVYACSRHLNTLVYSYIATAYSMCHRDVIARPYAYSYDIFHRCTNPHRVKVSTTPFVSTSSSHSVH